MRQITVSDRLLEGEDPRTTIARDARHWILVYRQMIDFKHELLGRVRTQIRKLPAAARSDVSQDISLIEDQLERYERRLEFWYSRHWDLEGLHVDSGLRTVTYREQSVALTNRELQLLVTLVGRSPAYVSAEQLLVEAWRDSQLPEEALRTYIVRLRRKIAQLGVHAEIVNQPRRGYAILFAGRSAG
jgi:DNA-binding response OmpR family regulator